MITRADVERLERIAEGAEANARDTSPRRGRRGAMLAAELARDRATELRERFEQQERKGAA